MGTTLSSDIAYSRIAEVRSKNAGAFLKGRTGEDEMEIGQKECTAEEKEEQQNRLAGQILERCRAELYRYFPGLDGAFAAVVCRKSQETVSIGTDGDAVWFCADFVIRRFAEDPALLYRGYLHMLLHCLMGHVVCWREDPLWDLACDMAVDLALEQGLHACPALWGQRESAAKFLNVKKEKNRKMPGSAESLYQWLKEQMQNADDFPEERRALEQSCQFDDHRFWQVNEDAMRRQKLQDKWERAGQRLSGNGGIGAGFTAGSAAGSREEIPDEIYKSRYDYRRFLRRFCSQREELWLDMDSFDYIYYSLGMERYGNLPLIEPLEYREANRLEDLVIAIDTSGSCKKETVQQFLGETFGILSEKENFFRKMSVTILQCDCCIQDVAVIHSEEEWEDYQTKVTIKGRGGTDFCPVFRYIEEQRAEGNLRRLKALIYFTDGDGVYPRSRPDYETAFVFVKKTKGMDLVPGWAMKLLVNG